MSSKRIIISIIVIASMAIAFYSMRGLLTPYVSFKEAMSSGSFVQIIGKREKDAPVNHFKDGFIFFLEDDDGTLMKIKYSGIKPMNFEHAAQVVAMRKYNKGSGLFESDKILVKCPSKKKKKK